MWKRKGLCVVNAMTLTLLTYLNKQDGTFPSLYAWVWLGLALVGLLFASNACLGKRISPRNQFLIVIIALVFTGAMLWGQELNAQRWRQWLYGVFLGFLYWEGIEYGIRLLREKKSA